MANTRDHRKLDAYATARLEVKRMIDSYRRRLEDEAYTEIDRAIQRELAAGRDYDGHVVGRAATLDVIGRHISKPRDIIEAGTSAIVGPAEESASDSQL